MRDALKTGNDDQEQRVRFHKTTQGRGSTFGHANDPFEDTLSGFVLKCPFFCAFRDQGTSLSKTEYTAPSQGSCNTSFRLYSPCQQDENRLGISFVTAQLDRL